jgi:hypothetical protein
MVQATFLRGSTSVPSMAAVTQDSRRATRLLTASMPSDERSRRIPQRTAR